MTEYAFAFSADWHLMPFVWKHQRDLYGDTYAAARQIVGVLQKYSVKTLVLGGDQFDPYATLLGDTDAGRSAGTVDRDQTAGSRALKPFSAPAGDLATQGASPAGSAQPRSCGKWEPHARLPTGNVSRVRLLPQSYSGVASRFGVNRCRREARAGWLAASDRRNNRGQSSLTELFAFGYNRSTGKQ